MPAVSATSAFWLISLILGVAVLHRAPACSSVGSGFRSALHAASNACTASHAVGYHAHVHSAQISLPVIRDGSELLLTCQRAWPLPLSSIPSGAVCFALPWRQRLDVASYELAGSRLSRCQRLRPDAGQAPEHRGVEEPERGVPRTVTPSLMRVARLRSHGDRHRLRERPDLSPRDRRHPLRSTCRVLPLLAPQCRILLAMADRHPLLRLRPHLCTLGQAPSRWISAAAGNFSFCRSPPSPQLLLQPMLGPRWLPHLRRLSWQPLPPWCTPTWWAWQALCRRVVSLLLPSQHPVLRRTPDGVLVLRPLLKSLTMSVRRKSREPGLSNRPCVQPRGKPCCAAQSLPWRCTEALCVRAILRPGLPMRFLPPESSDPSAGGAHNPRSAGFSPSRASSALVQVPAWPRLRLCTLRLGWGSGIRSMLCVSRRKPMDNRRTPSDTPRRRHCLQPVQLTGGSLQRSCRSRWLHLGIGAAPCWTPISPTISQGPSITNTACCTWHPMSYIWRPSTSSLLRNTRLLFIGSGISLRVASERPKAASVTCAHWIRSCRPGHQGALLETLALHSDVSSNTMLTQARAVLAWQPQIHAWLQPQLDNLLRLMLQRGMNGTASTCCPAASSCQGSARQAAALGMGRTGQARRNASRPGRWSRSLETGRPTT